MNPPSNSNNESDSNESDKNNNDEFEKLSNKEQDKLIQKALLKMFTKHGQDKSSIKEIYIVDFPIFKRGEQNPILWLKDFRTTCLANNT